MVLVRRFTGLVVLVLDGPEFDKTENSRTPRGVYGSISSTGLEEVAPCGHSRVSIPDHKRRRCDQNDGRYNPAQVRTGVGNSLIFVQTHVSRFARFQLACSCMQA